MTQSTTVLPLACLHSPTCQGSRRPESPFPPEPGGLRSPYLTQDPPLGVGGRRKKQRVQCAFGVGKGVLSTGGYEEDIAGRKGAQSSSFLLLTLVEGELGIGQETG